MRIDIHVHSKFSKRPSQWILKKIGCPESFTEPLQVYQVAKNRGMTHVTISDHNTIDGALEIAHLPDTFVSEEITTYFPKDNCKIHVLALDINESQHREIQKIRSDIYDLAAYLCREKIVNVVAHPLYAINERLTLDHFEQLLLLFRNFELNGARNQRENQILKQILTQLREDDIHSMAEKHNISALYDCPWVKYIWGGSDDHSALNIARTCTHIKGVSNIVHLKQPDHPEDVQVVGEPASPLTMGHNLYGIAYQFYRGKFNLARYTDKDVLMRFLDRNLSMNNDEAPGLLAKLYQFWHYRRDRKEKAPVSDSLMGLLRHETRQMIQNDPEFFDTVEASTDFTARERKWFDFVNRASQRVMLHFGNHLLDNLSGANLFNIFASIGSAGGLYTLLAPYFVAFSQFSKDRSLSQSIQQQFAPASSGNGQTSQEPLKIAHFTDTFYEVNGVALTLQQHVQLALKNKKDYTLITCHDTHYREEQSGIRNFKPIGSYALPEYPELKIFYPPLLKMLCDCYTAGFNHIHSATPGPIGLAALAIAKILKLPISGTYHTAIPQYAQVLTGDEAIEDMTWKYVLWYYDQLDLIYAPSKNTAEELVTRGIKKKKIRIYPRGIDTVLFNPAKRNGILKKKYAVQEKIKFLYVGRVSKEKNLHLLAQAFRWLVNKIEDICLIIVGEGPYYEEMQNEMQDLPCVFTGYLTGETLSTVYASSDVFVFPSTTDTFGNVVLEAQASGLPVIVTDQGGPCENMVPDKTGTVVCADDIHALEAAMLDYAQHPLRITRIGREARKYVENRSFETAFLNTWKMFNQEQQGLLLARAG